MTAWPLRIATTLLLLAHPAFAGTAPGLQQGTKLVGSAAIGAASQGYSVAVSGDGNTAIVGGYTDNSSAGAAWVYTRNAGAWTQQGAKLVGTGATGAAYQGYAVAMSADGNTAIVGGYVDNAQTGAAWVYARVNGAWTQQGTKLVGTGAVGGARQGYSVAVSSDGNTAVLGGYLDNAGVGAAWVFTRTAGVWSQQGAKLVGTGPVGSAGEGYSVAVSADGNTVLLGGYADNGIVGAVWAFTRTAGVWSQQGAKLVGTGAIGTSRQGYALALSADGSTALVGGYGDNGTAGALWAYTRSGGAWSQQGSKIICTGAAGLAFLGVSVGLSGDGNTAFAGGYADNGFAGAAWVFTRTAGAWSQHGTKLVGTGATSGSTGQGFSVGLSADGRTGIVGGYGDNANAGAAWAFVDPAPAFAAVSDVPNDQGGKVSLRWNASLADNEPADPIDAYWLWRQVPASMATEALSHGATLMGGDAAPAPASGRTFRRTTAGAQVVYWEFLGSQAADGYAGYSYTASTTSDSIPGSNPYTLFLVEAKQLSTGARWPCDPDSGYSVDNLAPAAPAPVAGAYAAGATHLHWGANREADLAVYRVYRGASALFVPGPANLVTSQPDTGYTDPGPAGVYYKLSAVDIHGNESPFALVAPGATAGVGDSGPMAFALEGARPNPSTGAALTIGFTLPSGSAARMELLDMSGRRVITREVGLLGAGRHRIDLAEGRRIAPGVYWVRLSQGANQRASRVAVIE